MIVVLAAGVWFWPEWTDVPTMARIIRLSILVIAAGCAYLGVLFASGFRLRDLRAV